MKKFVIERDLPGAGQLSAEQLEGISQKSCSVIHGMGSKLQWLESFVTGDKIYCVYLAVNEAALREHAEQGGFPVTNIAEVTTIISPQTAGADYVPA